MKKQLIIASAMLLIAIAINGAVSAADTTWSISASPDPIQSGQVLTYTVTITNNGQDVLIWPGLDVQGLSPDLINLQVSWDGSDWIGCSREQHYGFASISPGSSRTIYFRGTVKETTANSISSIFDLIDVNANILDQKTVTTTLTQPNQAPVANAGGPYTGTVGTPITFDASGSTDPDNNIKTYEWDLDGDGTYETTGKTVQKTWNSVYSGTISLKVTDTGGLSNTASTTVTVKPLTVTADIKPGTTTNTININSKGVIPVAIYSTSTFDAKTIDPSSVTFGRTGNEKSYVKYSWTDVNGDGILDLLLYFDTKKSGLILSDKEAFLKGLTTSKLAFEARDSIKTVPK